MMGRQVPLARRALFQDRRRAALAAGGVAAALLLVLLLQGIFDGAMRQVTAYLRSSPASVIVSQKDVRTMHMSVSALPPDTVAAVRHVDGVAWAEGIRYTTTFVTSAEGQQLSYVIGYDPATGRAGPRSMTSGRAPGTREIIIEQIAADRLGVHPGDTVTVFGAVFRVSGLFHGGTTITNSMAFITNDDFAAQRGDSIAYVLAGTRPGVDADELAARVAAALPATTVQTRDRFAHEEAALVKDMSADLMRIMSIIGFLIALAVIALTLYSLTVAKLREQAVVKALGARTGRLAAVILTQAAWSVLVAVALATVLAIAVGTLVERVSPAISIAIEPGSVVRVGITALAVGAVGALIPLRKMATVDAASAFRRTA
jgi:putative ABC transport system permease protein